MELSKAHEICDDCVYIFKDPAFFLSSKPRERKLTANLTVEYQSRLASNASLSRCHICVLIVERNPLHLELLNFEEQIGLQISHTSEENDDAALLGVIIQRDMRENILDTYGIRIQDGQQ
jgi:hypothetical protein